MKNARIYLNPTQTGEKIVEIAKKNGLTQVQLAKKLGVEPQVVNKWVKGRSLPNAENLLGLSRIFRCPIEKILVEYESVSA